MHANSTNANIGLGLNKETWVLSARVMVGAIVRPSRFWGCGAHRVSIAEKAPAKCACEGNRVGRHVILPIFDVPSHSVRRTPSELRAKNGSILRFSAYVMRDSRYVKRLMYLLSHTSVGRQMNNGKNRVPSHKKESGLPPLAQGVPLAVRVGHAIRLDGQELVNLDAVELEVQSAGGHVHTP